MSAPYLSLKPLVPWREVPRPIDWPGAFGRQAPLELEIGCGNGEVLGERAAQRPELNLVGLDQEWPSVRRALRRVNLAEAANVRLLQAEAGQALERLFVEQSLAGAACFCPRPWPKPSDAACRVFGHDFLRLLNSRLADRGRVKLLTDFRPFLDWVLQQVPGSGWQSQWRTVLPGLGSKYERKWMDQGQRSFFQLELSKIEHLPWPMLKEPKLHYPWLDNFEPERLETFEHLGQIKVFCKEVIHDPARGKALLRMVVVEDGLDQAFYLQVFPEEGRHRVRPAPGCGVLPSKGVQLAMELAAQHLGG